MGLIYTLTGETARAQIRSYGNSPRELALHRGAMEDDVKNIKTKVHKCNDAGTIYQSNFSIGFEIEKNNFTGRRNVGGAVTEYEMFRGYETDGSCGVEAITHVLPLVPPSPWRNKVFDMFYKARPIIEDSQSPSNISCGGHITIGLSPNCELSTREFWARLRPFAGLLMSLYRKRLRNSYCNTNLRMGGHDTGVADNIGSFHYKYQFALLKSSGVIEFRIPNRVQSVKSLFRRYELMYQLVDFAVNRPNARFSTFLAKVRPIVKGMYSGDDAKVDEIYGYAKDFRKFIMNGTMTENIRPFFARRVSDDLRISRQGYVSRS